MKNTPWIFLVLIFTLLLAACGSPSTPAASTPTSAPASDEPYPPPRPAQQVRAYPEPGSEESAMKTISWEEGKKLIMDGEVKQVTQFPDLRVELMLNLDDFVVQTTQPALNDVFQVVKDCGVPCKNIRLFSP